MASEGKERLPRPKPYLLRGLNRRLRFFMYKSCPSWHKLKEKGLAADAGEFPAFRVLQGRDGGMA
ncbi:hypothetical protein BIV59_05320 [Bacillus sp. MUM 13]|nr:hypothetical protein BIV59_05320 [Bacillus sp. MUM 13]